MSALDYNGLLYFWQKIKTRLDGKVDKESGKGLSANDYTTTEKNKLAGIASNANNYTLPKATTTTLGGVIIGNNLSVDSDGKLSAIQGTYNLPTASASILGGVKVGTNLSINSSGVLSSTDTKYTHPAGSGASKTSGLYKFSTDSTSHISNVAAVTKADITGLGIPGQDTTYSTASGSTNGLMSSTDKNKLDGFSAASNYALKSDVTNMYKYKGSKASFAALPTTGNTTGDVWNTEDTGMNYAWDGTKWDALGEIFTITPITNTEIDTIVAS